MKTEIPAKWANLLLKAGYEDPRYAGVASMRQLSYKIDVNTTTISRLITKGEVLSDELMQKIADALKVQVEELYGLATGVAARPMTLPAGTEKLTEREKNALAEIVRTLVSLKEAEHDTLDEKSRQPAEPAKEKRDRHLKSVARKRVIKPHPTDNEGDPVT